MRWFTFTCFACFALFGIGSSALAQESVYNAYIEGARKTQDEAEKEKLYRMAIKEAEGLNNPKLQSQSLIAMDLFEEQRGVYAEAERLMKQGLKLVQSLRDVADCYREMGKHR